MAGAVRACNVTIYYVHLQCRLLADVLYLYSAMLFDIEMVKHTRVILYVRKLTANSLILSAN